MDQRGCASILLTLTPTTRGPDGPRGTARTLAVGLLLAALGCGGDSGAPASDAAATGAQTGGTTAPLPTAGGTSAGRTGSAAGSSAGTAGARAGQAGTTGGSANGAAGVTGAAGASGSAAGSGAGAPATGSGGASASAAGSGAEPSTGGSGGDLAPAAGGGAAGTAGSPGAGTGTLAPEQTLIPHPSWDCGMPEGLPAVTGAPVFEAVFEVSEIHDIGETQFGYRHQLDISGGKVTGDKVNGDVLERGLDYQLVLSNGAVEVEQINIFRTDDRSLILARTCGAAAADGGNARITVDFEAPNGTPYEFLNTGRFVGTREVDLAAKTLKISVFEAGTADPANAVTVVEPDGVPEQTWGCKTASGSQGATVYTESVGIGGSLSLGASKRGTRNIIPITGGTTTGRVEGSVLSGGADFQIIANGTFEEIDARYSLKTNDGEIIIVRNCGPLGGLVPVFEASQSGKYAWLNANTWLSSNPGLGIGAVNLTIYETR
ncbi:MAG: DUF3237 family protein [Polyangiales bacterium]